MQNKRCCKQNNYCAEWCAVCFYRHAVESGVFAEKTGMSGKEVCMCDVRDADGVCYWRALYIKKCTEK